MFVFTRCRKRICPNDRWIMGSGINGSGTTFKWWNDVTRGYSSTGTVMLNIGCPNSTEPSLIFYPLIVRKDATYVTFFHWINLCSAIDRKLSYMQIYTGNKLYIFCKYHFAHLHYTPNKWKRQLTVLSAIYSLNWNFRIALIQIPKSDKVIHTHVMTAVMCCCNIRKAFQWLNDQTLHQRKTLFPGLRVKISISEMGHKIYYYRNLIYWRRFWGQLTNISPP